MDLSRLARYPFLPEAAEHAATAGPGLDELLTDRVYATARAKGRERVQLALDEAAVPAPPLTRASPERELLEELLAYAYARILVSALDDAYIVRRHALAEALRVREYLMGEDEVDALVAAARALGLAFEPDGDKVRAHFTEFLKFSVHLKDADWKLVSQELSRGHVAMTPHVASRLVQEALRRRIEGELPKRLSDEVADVVEPEIAPLREAARIRKETYNVEGGFGKVELSCIPPCMRHILGQLQRGENAPHNARFGIVTFLNRIGLSSEDIMRLFAQAPDFREDLTRYQVEHITGVTSGTTYNVPGCENLRTFNLCHADDLCGLKTKAGKSRVIFPTDYYKLLHEAKDEVDKIAAVVPIANPEELSAAAARRYPLLLRLREIAANPELPRVDGQLLANLALARRHPIKIEGEAGARKFVLSRDRGFELPDMLGEDWVLGALRAA